MGRTMKTEETPLAHARRLGDFEDSFVEQVTDDGEVTMRYPGGWARSFRISEEMVPYYRRLVASHRT